MQMILVVFLRPSTWKQTFAGRNTLELPIWRRLVETIFYKMRYSLSLFLTAVISISSVINDIPQDSIVTSKDRWKKVGSKEVNNLLIITQILLLHTT